MEFINQTPIIDTHDHTEVCGPKETDPIRALVGWYYQADLFSASSQKDVKPCEYNL
jgi:hypothetical protein